MRQLIVFALSVALAMASPSSAKPLSSFESTPCCLQKDERPLVYRLDVGQLGHPLLRRLIVGDGEKEVGFAGCVEPAITNIGDIGYCQVRYDDTAFSAPAAVFRLLAAEDRLGVLAERWAMVRADRADVKSFLDLLQRLTSETDLAMWTRVIDILREIDDLERGAPGRAAFRAFAIGLIKPQLQRLGWDSRTNEQDTARLDLPLRPLVITTLGRFGDRGVIDEARRRFTLFQQNPDTLSPELREAVATVVGFSADRITFDALRELGRKATTTEAKLRYYYALAGAHDPTLIEEAVAIALTDEVSSGRVSRYLAHAASDNDHPDELWRLVVDHRDAIFRKLTRAQQQGLLPSIARASSDPLVAFDLKWKIGAEASGGDWSEVDKAVEEIEHKAEFRERLLPKVDEWVKANGR